MLPFINANGSHRADGALVLADAAAYTEILVDDGFFKYYTVTEFFFDLYGFTRYRAMFFAYDAVLFLIPCPANGFVYF